MKKIRKRIIKNLLLGLFISIMLINTVLGSQVKKTIDVVYNRVNITVNGEKVNTDNILYGGTSYVPLRAVAEMLNKKVGWNGKTNTASINDKKSENPSEIKQENIKGLKLETRKTIEVVYNAVKITVNGEKVSTENLLYEGTTYAPLRAVSEMLDKEVGWHGKTNTASINDKGFKEKFPISSEESVKTNYLDNLFTSKDLLAEEFEKLIVLINPSNKNSEWALKLERNLQLIEKIAKDSIDYGPIPEEFKELQRLKILSMEEFEKMASLIQEDLKNKDNDLLFKAGNHLSDGTHYLNLLVDEVEYLFENNLLE